MRWHRVNEKCGDSVGHGVCLCVCVWLTLTIEASLLSLGNRYRYSCRCMHWQMVNEMCRDYSVLNKVFDKMEKIWKYKAHFDFKLLCSGFFAAYKSAPWYVLLTASNVVFLKHLVNYSHNSLEYLFIEWVTVFKVQDMVHVCLWLMLTH